MYISLDYLTLISPMSSALDRSFRCTSYNVELKSTRYFTVFYDGFFLSSCHMMSAFEIGR